MTANATATLNNRVSALIGRTPGITSVPQAAEHLGVGRAVLYGVLKAERDARLDDEANVAAVAQVVAALDKAEAEEGVMVEGTPVEAEGSAPEQPAPAPGAGPEPAAAPAAKPAAARKGKQAKTGKAQKPAAAAAKGAKGTPAASTTPPASNKPLALPTGTETLATTGAKVKVVERNGTESYRTVGPVKKREGGGYTARVRIANTIYTVAGDQAGTTWVVEGVYEPLATRNPAAAARGASATRPKAGKGAKAAEAAPSSPPRAQAAPKPAAKAKGKGTSKKTGSRK